MNCSKDPRVEHIFIGAIFCLFQSGCNQLELTNVNDADAMSMNFRTLSRTSYFTGSVCIAVLSAKCRPKVLGWAEGRNALSTLP